MRQNALATATDLVPDLRRKCGALCASKTLSRVHREAVYAGETPKSWAKMGQNGPKWAKRETRGVCLENAFKGFGELTEVALNASGSGAYEQFRRAESFTFLHAFRAVISIFCCNTDSCGWN
jgi:hypothetical protein